MELTTHKHLDEAVLPKINDFKPSHDDIETANGTSPAKFTPRTHEMANICMSILKGAVPSMIQLFSALLVNNLTLHFIGKRNDTKFYDAICIANNILTCFSFYVVFHTNIGLNAATSQAYGAHRYRLVGLYLHRALIIHLTINSVVYLFLYNSHSILKAMGIHSEIAEIASHYLMLSPGYILGSIIFDTIKNFLYAHGIFNPQVVCQIIISFSYYLYLNHFFTDSSAREEAIIIGLTISQLIGTVLLICYVQFRRPFETTSTWFFFDRESFHGLWQLFKIMLGVGVMGYIEVLAYKIQSFVAIYLPETQMAAYVTFLSFDDLYYVLPVGIAISLTSTIGNAIGSRDKDRIIRIIKATLWMGAGLLVVLLALFAAFKGSFFDFYTINPEIQKILYRIGHVYYAFFFADFFQNIFAGVLKGLGQEQSGTRAFLFSVYLVALPLSMILAFHFDFEAVGMWMGTTVGVYIALSCYIWIFMKTDMNVQFNYINHRIEKTDQH